MDAMIKLFNATDQFKPSTARVLQGFSAILHGMVATLILWSSILVASHGGLG
jgi:hypothetical protein